MSDLVERVARAIYEADDPWHKAWPWPDLQSDQAGVDQYRRIAQAAIAAMQADAEPVADERAVCIARAVDYAVANWSLVTAELKASRLEEVLRRYGMKIVVDDRVSPPTSVDDSETGNTSDKLRSAVEVWRDAYDAFTDFYCHTTEKDAAAVIEQDRAELVAEIERLRKLLLNAADWLKDAPIESGICCCGDPIEGHGYYSGHSPVDAVQYSAMQLREEIRAALEGTNHE